MKKLLKKIKKGNHAVMMQAIEDMIDAYNEQAFDEGRRSLAADMAVYSGRLAEKLFRIAKNTIDKRLTVEEAADIIRNFFETEVV